MSGGIRGVIILSKQLSSSERAALLELHHRARCDSVQLWRWLEPDHCPQAALERYRRQTRLFADQGYAEAESLLARHNARAVTWRDDEYPALLTRHEHPPPVLYVQGSLKEEDNCSVAIVGSRRATRWARRLAYELARDLAALGITVVSGLAAGVDTAAHEGALETGRTIAVIGCGIDHTYPAQNRELQRRIAEKGAVISQFPCGTPPRAFQFPLRNDTIVRLCLGVVVVEAPERSGALLTANRALERDVELMVCPGDAGRPSCRGSNALLKVKGTAAVETAADVIEALRLETTTSLFQTGHTPVSSRVPDWLTTEPQSVEELARKAGMPVGMVRARLVELELVGLAIRLDGERFRAAMGGQ